MNESSCINQGKTTRRVLSAAGVLASLLFLSGGALAETSGDSESVTWTCQDSPCPWGGSTSGEALVWPGSSALNTRLGYAVSAGIYLPAEDAEGITVAIDSGSASVYAGQPDAQYHDYLGTITPGAPLEIAGLEPGEVVSVQSGSSFSYTIIEAPEPEPEPDPVDPFAGTAFSSAVTWSCTSQPCPWGGSVSGQAIAWTTGDATASRLGYTTSEAIYLPAASANGLIISVDSGSATAYAGLPNADFHRSLGAILPGQPFQVTGLATGEVLSVQDSQAFSFQLTVGEDPGEPTDPSDPVDPDPVDPSDPNAGLGSEWVTWTCTSSPCPWGSPLGGDALVWPAGEGALTSRLGYTVSAGVYLPAEAATDKIVTITSGSATVYAGEPGATSHYVLANIATGQSYQITGLAYGEVVSVQSSSAFDYELSVGEPTDPVEPPPGEEEEPTNPTDPDGTIYSVPGQWKCNSPDCHSGDWFTEVIAWPSWAAYNSNARSGDNSKAVYSPEGEPLYPYMGSWADGCEVTAVSGTVLIIEWERGTDVWRETWLEAGQTHTIDLVGTEDGAMIESFDFSPGFSVTLANCDPQPLP